MTESFCGDPAPIRPDSPCDVAASLHADMVPGPTDATALTAGDAGGQPPADPALDAHGFDPADYDWIPVRRQPRPDGWTEEKQRTFISTLADTGSVREAVRSVGKSARSAYALRRAPEGAGFARAWTAALRQGMNRLVDVCLERAMEGSEEAIHDREGRVIGMRTRYHDRMAMFLLRAHMPELFRDAHRADRARGEVLPPAPEPVAQAALAIDPVPPAEPHKLMPPDELDDALTVADILEGKLPRWRRDRDVVAREAAEAKTPPDSSLDVRRARRSYPRGPNLEPEVPEDDHGDPIDHGPHCSPLGAQFERDLAAAKRGDWHKLQARRRRRRNRGRAKGDSSVT